MSAGRRTYDLLRGYVNREWDRIHGMELTDAQKELDDALDASSASYKITPRPRVEIPPEDAKAYARQVLGVEENADFETIRHAFEKLCKRSDPQRFPIDSEEAKQASDIQKRIYWAYNLLTENVDEIEMRFRSLEID
ncbi:MAG: hypothetical protein QOJ65_2166 [Fimbriimonadaceae bacterium]|nr:hypothetical protein [Fimbriimonadaceae bacterium]